MWEGGKKVLPGFEPGSLDSKSRVLTNYTIRPLVVGLPRFTPSDVPSWLSWQSARLLTDRSLVRAQVRAFLPVGGTGGSSGTPRFTRIVRSYHGENVRSRPISETKHHWANSVLTWGTSWESLVLNVFGGGRSRTVLGRVSGVDPGRAWGSIPRGCLGVDPGRYLGVDASGALSLKHSCDKLMHRVQLA